MRGQVRALVLVFVSLCTAMALGIASAFVAALAYGATALIVPGTGTPNADVVDGYRENAWSRYIDVACTFDCSEPDLVGIPYPASFWPVSFIPGWCVTGRCDKWNVSVGDGTENLLEALTPFLDPESDEDVYIFGYSQGGAVVANVLTEIGLLDLPQSVKDRLKTVTIGGIENPDGGLWQRLAWLQHFLG
ncbi:PE-PPE domain-containing protein, partial [Mycobacterium sp. ITM-2017-0098]